MSDVQKLWCSVDRSLRFYESELSADPCLQISLRDVVCLGVSRPDPSSNNNGLLDRCVCSLDSRVLLELLSQRLLSNRRFCYSFELYLTSEKLHHFGLETAEALQSWTRSIGKVGLRPAAASALGTGVTVLCVPSGGHAPQLPLPADPGV